MKFIPNSQAIRAFSRYLLVGLAVFVVGLVWHFPFERVKTKLITTISKQTGYQLDMEKLSPALPLGFSAKNARLSGGPPVMGKPLSLEFKSLKVSLSPFSLLLYPVRKTWGISYAAEQADARFTGSLSYGKENSGFEIQTKNYSINETFPMNLGGDLGTGAPAGKLSLITNLAVSFEVDGPTAGISRSDFSTATGKLTLTANKLSVAMEPSLMKIPAFDKVVVKAEMDKGKIDIKSITLTGAELSGTASGSVKIEPYFPRSQLQLDAKLTLSDKAEGLRALVTTMGSSLGLKLDDKGTVALKVTGPISPIDRLTVRGY